MKTALKVIVLIGILLAAYLVLKPGDKGIETESLTPQISETQPAPESQATSRPHSVDENEEEKDGDLKSGLKETGSEIKKGAKATGRGFKKAGRSIKNFFSGDKEKK